MSRRPWLIDCMVSWPGLSQYWWHVPHLVQLMAVHLLEEGIAGFFCVLIVKWFVVLICNYFEIHL